MFESALSSLKTIVADRGGEHADILHEAISQAQANPQQLADVVGKLSRHPEFGEEVRSWMGSPQGQSIMASFGGMQARPSEQDSIAQAEATQGTAPQSAADQMQKGVLNGAQPVSAGAANTAPVPETADPGVAAPS